MADLSASATGRFGGLEQQHVDHPAADERLARSMPGLGGGDVELAVTARLNWAKLVAWQTLS